MSKSAKRRIVLILVTFVSFSAFWGVLLYQHKTEEEARVDRVKLAREHAEKVSPVIAKDKRFDYVRVSDWWGEGGKLLVSGFIESEADLQAQQTLVRGTRPPVPVAWQVGVVGSGPTNSNTR